MKLIITDFEKNSKRIKLKIPYQAFEWRKLIKSFTGSFYHPNQKLWSIPNTKENLHKVERYFGKSIEYVAKNKTPKRPFIELNREILRMMEFAETKLILSGKAVSTQKQYKGELLRYFKNFEGRKMQEVSKEEIETYVYKLKKNYDISDSKQNIIINAIKFYHEKVLEQDRTYYNITRPKKDKILPGVLSENEVMKLLESTLNIKHKTILTVMYGSGLRISEVVNLRIQDIKSDNMQIFVKSSKGDKDRMTPLSKHCLTLLRDYYRKHKPSFWLFEGRQGGKYSVSSIQRIFRRAVEKSGINSWATPHTLRHSFATHLLQANVNLRYIQSALGHSNPKTTEIYTKVIDVNNENVKSPLDRLLDKYEDEKKYAVHKRYIRN